jgi:hypothetical protein
LLRRLQNFSKINFTSALVFYYILCNYSVKTKAGKFVFNSKLDVLKATILKMKESTSLDDLEKQQKPHATAP